MSTSGTWWVTTLTYKGVTWCIRSGEYKIKLLNYNAMDGFKKYQAHLLKMLHPSITLIAFLNLVRQSL
jgi:hypothetical protein